MQLGANGIAPESPAYGIMVLNERDPLQKVVHSTRIVFRR